MFHRHVYYRDVPNILLAIVVSSFLMKPAAHLVQVMLRVMWKIE